MNKTERKKAITALVNKVNTNAKHKVIGHADELFNRYIVRRPSGIMHLDVQLRGGLPATGQTILAGPEGCLAEDTFVQFSLIDENGNAKSHKGGSIKRLFERFHNIDPSNKRCRNDERTTGFKVYLPSVNEECCIFRNRVVDVVDTGIKECFEICTKNGHTIQATADHKFFTGDGYTPLSELVEGSTVYVHENIVSIPDKVIKITQVGPKHTYDIKMASPYNNFVANNFVVHNSGKTFLMYQFMKMNQRIFGENSAIAIAPVEHPFDHMYCRKMGLLVSVPDQRIEMEQEFRRSMGWPLLTKDDVKFLKVQVGHVLGIVADSMEDMLNIVLDCVEKNCFQITGVDSITAAIPEAQAKADDVGDWGQQGLHASILGKFYKYYAPYTTGFEGANKRNNETTLIFTQQARSNKAKSEAGPRGKYMKDWDASGSAWSGKHHKMVELTVWSGAREKEKGEKGQRTDTIAKTINWEITKGKGGIHEGLVGEMEYSFENFVDVYSSVLAEGIRYGVLQERNGLIEAVDPVLKTPIEGVEALPYQGFIEQLVNDWKVEEKIRKAIIYSATGAVCLYQ